MKSITLGLALSLLGGAAMAQTPTPSAPLPPTAAPAPAAAPTSPMPRQNAQAATPGTSQASGAAPGGPPEGMIVETPNGFYLVRPGEQKPRRLDLGQDNVQPDQGAQMGQNGQADEPAMDDTADEGLQSPPPPPGSRHPMPPRPEGKGARFRIKTPNLTLGMKCPDDEPIKACVDAVSQLLDKANTPAH